MPLPMKMKTNVSLLVLALTLVMTTVLFKEVFATSRQRQMITEKGINVQSSVEAAAAARGLALWQSVQNGQPNRDVAKPRPQHKSNSVHSSFEEVAAGSQCNKHVPTPCPPTPQAKKEQQVKGNGKAELMTNYQTSINAGKHASTYHSY
jgi:hypothetical protein